MAASASEGDAEDRHGSFKQLEVERRDECEYRTNIGQAREAGRGGKERDGEGTS